jgi:hypothetical protein
MSFFHFFISVFFFFYPFLLARCLFLSYFSPRVQNFDNQVKAVVGAHMKENKNKWQTTAGQSNKDRQYEYGNSFSASTMCISLSHQAS